MKFKVTPEDLKRGKLVPPAWYNLQITKVEEKPADTDGSMNWIMDFVIKGGEYDGVPVRRYWNEKYHPASNIEHFLEAFGVKVDDKAGIDIDFQKTVGKELKAFIKNQLDKQNVMRNNIVDFAPATATNLPKTA